MRGSGQWPVPAALLVDETSRTQLAGGVQSSWQEGEGAPGSRGVRAGRPGPKVGCGPRGAEAGPGRGSRVLLDRGDLVNPQAGRRLRVPSPGEEASPLWSRLVCGGRGEVCPPVAPQRVALSGLLLWDSAGLLGGRPGWRGLVFVHSPEKKAPWTQYLPDVSH